MAAMHTTEPPLEAGARDSYTAAHTAPPAERLPEVCAVSDPDRELVRRLVAQAVAQALGEPAPTATTPPAPGPAGKPAAPSAASAKPSRPARVVDWTLPAPG